MVFGDDFVGGGLANFLKVVFSASLSIVKIRNMGVFFLTLYDKHGSYLGDYALFSPTTRNSIFGTHARYEHRMCGGKSCVEYLFICSQETFFPLCSKGNRVQILV